MMSPVRFCDAVMKLSLNPLNLAKKVEAARRDAMPVYDLLKVDPHSALRGPIKAILESISREKNISYASVLDRGVSSVKSTIEAAGRLYCLGYPVLLK